MIESNPVVKEKVFMPLNLQFFALKDSIPEGLVNPLLMDDPEPEADQEPVASNPEVPSGDTPTEPFEKSNTPVTAEPVPQQPMQPVPAGITKEDMQAIMQELLAKQGKSDENAPAEPTEEELQAMKDSWMDEFYNDPKNAIQRIVEEATKPYKERLQQQDEEIAWRDRANRFIESRPDAKEKVEAITNLLMQRPELQSLHDAYDVAYKLLKADEPAKAVTPNELPKEIRDAIIQDYIKSLNSEQPPQLIGKQVGQAPISAGEKPKTIKEASKMAFFK